jgi:hypothetical protein
LKETFSLVGDPEIPGSVFGNAIHGSRGKALYRNKSIILEVAEFKRRGDPHSPARILKERLRSHSTPFPVAHAEGDDLSVLRSVQVTATSEQDTAILRRQDPPSGDIRQALFHRNRRDGNFLKAIETVISTDPNAALTILKKAHDVFARQAVRSRKYICSTVVDVNQAHRLQCHLSRAKLLEEVADTSWLSPSDGVHRFGYVIGVADEVLGEGVLRVFLAVVKLVMSALFPSRVS